MVSTRISIHAPAWGATENVLDLSLTCPNFNPRSRVGSDLLSPTFADFFAYDFNPRSRVGSDDTTADEPAEKTISIHAPAWGATALPARLLP